MEKQSIFPIPVTILTGFLGAGKTTVLNHILNADHGLRVALLVNDFGAINIDSQLVSDVSEQDTIELSNGCICCTIRGDLLQAMMNMIRRENPPEYIIIEASGVSDPLEIALTFRTPELQNTILVDSVLTVIDTEQVRGLQGENEILAVMQVGAADLVLLNKVDLVSDAQRTEVKKWVKSIVPKARILEASYGQVPVELILGIGKFSPDRLHNRAKSDIHVHDETTPVHAHHDHSVIFNTWSWTSTEPLSLKALQRTVENLPVGIFRAKGTLHLADDPDRVAYLQVVGKRASVRWGRHWEPEERKSQFVVIGREDSFDPAELQKRLNACLAANAPKSEIGRLAKSVMDWLRS